MIKLGNFLLDRMKGKALYEMKLVETIDTRSNGFVQKCCPYMINKKTIW